VLGFNSWARSIKGELCPPTCWPIDATRVFSGPTGRRRLTYVSLAIVLETATTLGALTGVFFIGLVPVSFLYGLFAVVLLVSAQALCNG